MKYLNKKNIIITILILEIITLVMCEKKTESSEEYKAAQKDTDQSVTNYTVKNKNQKNQVYLLYFFSTDNNSFAVSSDNQLAEEGFHIDLHDESLLNANTILKGNIKTKDKMEVMLGRKDTWRYLLDNYVYIVGDLYMWSYQIFGIYSISESEIENINFNDRTEFNNYINTLFLMKDEHHHSDPSLQQAILEDWHIVSLYIPSSSSQENGYIIQATLRSVSSL
ncbi:hypothetical protein ACTQ5A_11080 [Bacillota bacterium LCP21S3_F9]